MSHGNDTQHSSLTDSLSPSKCHPVSSPRPRLFHPLSPPAPLCSPPVLRSHVHLGVVPVLHCAAEVYNLRRLLVWLHLASSSVLYFFCRNSKLGCLPCLSLCHRRSLLCEIKAKTPALAITFTPDSVFDRGRRLDSKEKHNTIRRSCQTV